MQWTARHEKFAEDTRRQGRLPTVLRREFALVATLVVFTACDDDLVSAVDPLIEVDPKHLDFGTVELGQQAELTVTVRNLENVPAKIVSVDVTDDCNGCFLAVNPPTDVPGLSKHELVMRFRAVRLPEAKGTLTITTDDPKARVNEVTMVGRGSDMRRPDIEVAPQTVDFGFVPAGGIAVSSFAIRSTGTNDLLIDRIYVDPPDAPFRVTTSTPSPERPGRLSPGAQASVGLRATLPMTETGTITARVIIETNVPEEKNVPGQVGQVQVPLTALANLPPLAVCGGNINVEPWSRVNLDGTASHDQDNPPDEPLTYQWLLVTQPEGSITTLERANTPEPSFWVDLSGKYEVELTVTDALGLESQAPCRVVVEALPTNAVRIELIWDHPDSDLDLHLVRQDGDFCDCATDCHYRDCGRRPNWFPMTPGANPRLDVDDRGGFGPETIDIDGEGTNRFIPEGTYSIYVHYFATNEEVSSWPTSASNATIRVFIFGLLAAEIQHRLDTTGDLWLAGQLRWPQMDVVPDGTVFVGTECGVF